MEIIGRRFAVLFLALSFVGCDGFNLGQKGPSADDPNALPSEQQSGSAENQGSVLVFFSDVADKPEQNKLKRRNIAAACARAIGTAQRTLDVACHEIDNRVVIEAILEAHLRGVRVRVITETDYLEDLGPQSFLQADIPVISDRRSALMHNKFMVIDGVAVWTGSFNFTENCAYKNNNNGLYIRSPKVAKNFSTWFDWFWNEGSKGGRRKHRATEFPSVELADKTVVETQLTTFDPMDQLAIEVIKGAKKSIKFMAFSFTHKEMAQAMIDRARAGVKVYGVFEQRNLTVSVYNMLVDEPNVTVLPDGNNFNMHHKVIIVDDSVVLTGSFNFSKNAVSSNDENYVVISRNKGVADQFSEEFYKVYKAAGNRLAAREGSTRR
jgi:phosphatidylserine/phosphatidylglycerophosphate/cardiolipin synthase-like enzyme